MHNKSMFLESKILFKSNKIKIDYEIRSKNSSKIIKESITSQERGIYDSKFDNNDCNNGSIWNFYI